MDEAADESAEVIPPLRNRKVSDGTLYTRSDDVERLLAGLVALPEDEILSRAAITRRSAPGWLPGECLVFMMRRASRRRDRRAYDRWCTLVLARIRARMPYVPGTGPASSRELEMADYGLNRFGSLLGPDLDGYNEKLDIYEAVFDLALANLRRDALRTVLPAKGEPTPVELGSDPRLELEVERAKSGDDIFGHARENDEDFRSTAWAAIDALPTEQNRILTMIREGVPPGEMAAILGLSPRTLLNHKNAAIAAVRALVAEEGR